MTAHDSVGSIVLYTYHRSSPSQRVRIALNLKGLKPEYRFVDLFDGDGAHNTEAYRRVNPQGVLPSLIHDGRTIGQSLAIIEYLDEIVPKPPLLPQEPWARARVRRIAQIVACDMHPVNSLRVAKYLRKEHGLDDAAYARWWSRWTANGFAAIEALLAESPDTGRFCHGGAPTIADVCVVPAVDLATASKFDLSAYPTVRRVAAEASALPAFLAAKPENQPDAKR